jgi:hypothetical protein
MKTFRNSNGCEMNFDDSITEEEVNKRLSWLGKEWREVKNE